MAMQVTDRDIQPGNLATERPKVLVADCNDSFVYNLIQLLRESGQCTYDVASINEIPFCTLKRYSHILLSPGPGLPGDFPNLHRLIDATHKTHSILGVCLGMQAIGEYYQCRLTRLPQPKHGHPGRLVPSVTNTAILRGISQCQIARYHSWVIAPDSLSGELEAIAEDEDGNIMAIRHRLHAVYGLQFHPESIVTEYGSQFISNWLAS